MAWEENPRICLHMQLIAILSRTGVFISIFALLNRKSVDNGFNAIQLHYNKKKAMKAKSFTVGLAFINYLET